MGCPDSWPNSIPDVSGFLPSMALGGTSLFSCLWTQTWATASTTSSPGSQAFGASQEPNHHFSRVFSLLTADNRSPPILQPHKPILYNKCVCVNTYEHTRTNTHTLFGEPTLIHLPFYSSIMPKTQPCMVVSLFWAKSVPEGL